MSQLFHLLTDLAIDPNKQRVFASNPNALMDRVNLSEAERTAMMSGESAKIAALFTKELAQPAISIGDPGPDPLPDPDPVPPTPDEPKPDSDEDEV